MVAYLRIRRAGFPEIGRYIFAIQLGDVSIRLPTFSISLLPPLLPFRCFPDQEYA